MNNIINITDFKVKDESHVSYKIETKYYNKIDIQIVRNKHIHDFAKWVKQEISLGNKITSDLNKIDLFVGLIKKQIKNQIEIQRKVNDFVENDLLK